ncbi:Ulp1 protease family, C-terminal catalytic domain [Phytophthora cactorum]|nr:Ulp1 protease family, C-terminal catalytic domain [Phytophthora cactorum]
MTRISAPSGSCSGGSSDSRYSSNTLEFDAVASVRSVPRNHGQFDFGQDSPPHRQLEGPHAPDKYKSGRPKASGQSISAPGSSFTSSSTAGVTDGVLSQQFNPPKTQDSFLENLTKRNTRTNRGPGTTRKEMAYSIPASSLEIGSAPTPKKDISRPHTGSSGWVNTRAKQPVSKPRTLLTAAEKRTKLSNNARKTSSLCAVSIRNARATRLGKRKMSSEGSAAKPIALDSDSDSEPEVQSESTCKDIVADTRKNGSKKNQEAKSPAIDLDEIALHAMARIDNCDVMIGLFQCIVDLIFQGDRMCMRNIRGKNENWPFNEYYLFSLDKLHDAIQCVQGGCAEIEVDVEEPDQMEQLLDEAPYMAFKLPFSSEDDQAAVKIFYDPTSPASSYPIFLNALTLVYIFVDREDKEQAKEHLQALVKDPFSYQSCRRSSQRNSTEADAESPSESEEDDAEGTIPVLTYPLPPCTSDIVTIIRRDVSRLKPRRYLNDNIIDYHFKRMMLDSFRENKIVQEKVLFLSSHFYSRLRAGKGASARERMEAGYKNVATWLARSNFFNRSIIFIPINKEFLRMQWENSQERAGEDKADLVSEYGVERVLTVNVKAPQQENSYDCGVYVLKFAEVILKNCLELNLLDQNKGVIGKDVTDENLEALITSSAFSAEDITATRKQIRRTLNRRGTGVSISPLVKPGLKLATGLSYLAPTSKFVSETRAEKVVMCCFSTELMSCVQYKYMYYMCISRLHRRLPLALCGQCRLKVRQPNGLPQAAAKEPAMSRRRPRTEPSAVIQPSKHRCSAAEHARTASALQFSGVETKIRGYGPSRRFSANAAIAFQLRSTTSEFAACKAEWLPC